MHNLLEYGENCSKTSESLHHYCRDELTLDNTADFTNDKATDLFKFLKNSRSDW